MSETAIALEEETERVEGAPVEPEIVVDPKNVAIDIEGQKTRSLFVRLPEGMTAADLGDPRVWHRVQKTRPVSLLKFDRLTMVAFDESWLAEALVADASPERAVLARPSITKLEHSRFDKLFSDPNYRIAWNGAAFAVIRKKDGFAISSWATEQLAIAAIGRLYPKPV